MFGWVGLHIYWIQGGMTWHNTRYFYFYFASFGVWMRALHNAFYVFERIYGFGPFDEV
jgi:hypothetical protein